MTWHLFLLLAFTGHALGETYRLLSGFFGGQSIVALDFDETASSLSVVENMTLHGSGGSKWIALSKDEEELYVATQGAFQSYRLNSTPSLEYQSNITLSSNCSNANFVVASTKKPFAVFGAPYSGACSSVAMSVDKGALQASFANLTYNSKAAVHGLALSPDEDFVYSADDTGNAIWVHSYDRPSGVIKEVQRLSAPSGANPRHLTVHPSGSLVYVIYEELNELAVYKRELNTGKLTDPNITYSLLPSGYSNTSSYWSDEVLLSFSHHDTPKYAITGVRSHDSSKPGFVSIFSLDAHGNIDKQLFTLPTTGSGGSANAVSPAKFSEEYFGITDSGSNFIEVWKINESGSSASSVAHLDLDGSPANIVWLG
ncbi:carboxy-cis cis-muconate cyclase [Fusarium beomiforme]|uniref:Carboxy-cis cis-muconate cyclase n=1 Tax=Fusarium beomiforme TaxID=44412 RepID=A0A9P5AVZ7_9HYPO|nr:carboxy-cis cis-muconate cyclase [Fusarium beomiforme]